MMERGGLNIEGTNFILQFSGSGKKNVGNELIQQIQCKPFYLGTAKKLITVEEKREKLENQVNNNFKNIVLNKNDRKRKFSELFEKVNIDGVMMLNELWINNYGRNLLADAGAKNSEDSSISVTN